LTPITLHAANPGPFTGAGNWTYLIPGPAPLLFDAGVGRATHLEALAAAVPDGPALVVVSHAHPDHASGAPVLAARWPVARFGKVPWPAEDDRVIAWDPLTDGQAIDSGEGPLVVIHTPGHAPDHLVLWHAESRTLFGADLMQLGNTVAIPADRSGDLAAYLRSLRRVQALSPARVLPAHGPPIEDPSAVIEQYLQHRHHREVQIVTALEGGLQTVNAITERIYAGLTPHLEPLARQNVLAHLIKLEQEGLARRDGDRWLLLT
jgi:glyoxylase-like metal-dependent hydrolase (beta-lactamase superfamily II)